MKPITPLTLWTIYAIFVIVSQAMEYILVSDLTKTWADAEAYCLSTYGTHLATVTDDVSAQRLLDLTGDVVWIGLNDVDQEGVWTYSDGMTCLGVTTDGNCGSSYSYWASNEPNGATNENCVEMYGYSTSIHDMLNDLVCTHEKQFVCNKPRINVGYDAYPQMACGGINGATYDTVSGTFDECVAACDYYETCISFEFYIWRHDAYGWSHNCILSQSCDLSTATSGFTGINGIELFIKNGMSDLTTIAPSFAPSEAPTIAQCDAVSSFVWEDLMQSEEGKPNTVATLSVDTDTLSLNIEIEADYLGYSAADDNGYLYGTTYVINFEDFDAHEDNIKLPGVCENRRADAFDDSALTWNDVWSYSTAPNTAGHVGSSEYLAYPPGNLWTVEMSEDDVCSIKYSTTLTWNQLTSCTNYDGSDGSYIATSDNANNVTLSGTLYINVVSPYDYSSDYGFYRVYQLLSQPFMIVVSKTTYVLGKVGINLLTMDIISVYKEDEENTFRLIVLTEAAEYLQLSRDGLGESSAGYLFQTFVPSDSSNPITSANFRMLEAAETESGCLGNKQYICSQLWQFTADDVECTTDGIFTDFSGTYSIQFNPQCRSAADLGGDSDLNGYCNDWLADHEDEISDSTAGGKVLLSAGLSWRDEICDPQIFTVQFSASMQFYTDAAFSNEVVDPSTGHLFQVGEDVIYVKVTTDYPDNTFSVFATELLNVWICTFDPLVTPDEITVDSQEGGCFDTNVDDNSDNFVSHRYDLENGVILDGFALDETTTLESNEIQFQLLVPDKVHRDTLYIHAQIEVSLSNGRRRRMLLKSRRARAEEANQMDHFVNKVGVGSTPHDDHKPLAPDDHNYPQQPFEAPQAPISPPSQPWVISLQSPWLIAVGCLLAVVLTVNIIFMCYTNCVQPNSDGFVSFSRRPKYKQVAVDSEEFSEHDAINVLSN